MRSNSSTILIIILALGIFGAACQQVPKADNAVVTEASPDTTTVEESGNIYKIDTSTSSLVWIGTKPTGEHKGTFNILDGQLILQDSTIIGGNIKISISSLQNVDLSDKDDMRGQLETELKGPNFFDISKFPLSTFVITEVTPFTPAMANENTILLKDATHMVKGNLTLKDSTRSIAFPAKISITPDQVLAQANFNMDRTKWGMKYRADKSLQDKLINSQVNISLSIVAKR